MDKLGAYVIHGNRRTTNCTSGTSETAAVLERTDRVSRPERPRRGGELGMCGNDAAILDTVSTRTDWLVNYASREHGIGEGWSPDDRLDAVARSGGQPELIISAASH
jgi:hypothetical protein